MSERMGMDLGPLWNLAGSPKLTPQGAAVIGAVMSPKERGIAGSDDAEHGPLNHAERMPAFVLDALGLALQSFNRAGLMFSFEQVRTKAEASEAVKGWLAASTRTNVLGGWTRSRVRLFKLVRCGDQETTRANRRGARATLWRFPTP